MADRLAFVFDKNLKSLNEEIEKLIFTIKNPLAGKNAHVIKIFTKQLIKAHKNQNQGKTRRKLPKESLILKTETATYETPAMQVTSATDNDFEIPAFPIPPQKKKLSMESIHVQHRREPSLTKEPEKKPQPKPKKEIVLPKLEEERLTLIATRATGKEMAHALVKGIIYTVHEESLSQDEVEVLNFMRPLVEKKKEVLGSKKRLFKLLKKAAKKSSVNIDNLDQQKIRYFLVKHIINYGLIDPLLYDQNITKIVCDGDGLKVQIIRNGKELITNIEYRNPQQLNRFLQRVAKKAKKPLSEDEPILEADVENYKMKATLGTEDIPSRFVMERLA